MSSDPTDKRPRRAANKIGPTGRQVAKNLRQLRDKRGLSVKELSERLEEEAGLNIPPSGITRIENAADLERSRESKTGIRRVDVDDLMGLALALRVPPNALLLPRRLRKDEDIQLTEKVAKNGWVTWTWADGHMPLPGSWLNPDGTVENSDQEATLDHALHARPHAADGKEPELPEVMRTLRGLIFNIRALQDAGTDQSRWAPRVVGIKRLMNKLVRQLAEELKDYPIEKTWYAEDAAEEDEALAKLFEEGLASYTRVSAADRS